MAQLVATLPQVVRPLLPRPTRGFGRWAALAGLTGLMLASPELFALVAAVLSEAYLAVTVFVAGTLTLIYGLERVFKGDIGALLVRLRRWQVPVAALLGAFPGCGGAIVIVTQFTRGYASFGSLVATLTATMGDAMFLLLAREPATAGLILGVGLAVGAVSGLVVDAIHGESFLRPSAPARASAELLKSQSPDGPGLAKGGRWLERIWLALAVPGLVFGLAAALQLNLSLPGTPFALDGVALGIGVLGAVLSLVLWALGGDHAGLGSDPACPPQGRGILSRIVADSSFISAWVVFAFLAYELTLFFTGADLGRLFALWAPLVPLAAIAVGFLPGCGPQIVVTTLYLAGSLPLSAQVGNAISNDGDALFPAIALAPKAAVAATLYSAVPAVLVAYGFFWLMQ